MEEDTSPPPADTPQRSADRIKPPYSNYRELLETMLLNNELGQDHQASQLFWFARWIWSRVNRELAISYMDEAIEIDPSNPLFRWQRFVFLIQRQDWTRALDGCEDWVRLRPCEALAYLARARCYRELYGEARAEPDCCKAIELEPGVAFFYEMRADAYRSLGRTAEAEADEAKAKELNAESPD